MTFQLSGKIFSGQEASAFLHRSRAGKLQHPEKEASWRPFAVRQPAFLQDSGEVFFGDCKWHQRHRAELTDSGYPVSGSLFQNPRPASHTDVCGIDEKRTFPDFIFQSMRFTIKKVLILFWSNLTDALRQLRFLYVKKAGCRRRKSHRFPKERFRSGWTRLRLRCPGEPFSGRGTEKPASTRHAGSRRRRWYSRKVFRAGLQRY